MKVSAIIAEYNPLHLGHIKQIEYVKNTLKADKIIVIMSGNFTQRGEPAVINKFKRASEAVKAGANIVIELPTVFATSNAELFAKGAIKIINSINVVDTLCFGIESGTKQDYINLAREMNNESKEFKKILKEKLEGGISLAKAKFVAIKEMGKTDLSESIISTPNNILGLEYTKALLTLNSNIQIEPLIRENIHNEKTLKKGITSAMSIREAIKQGNIKKTKKYLPSFTYKDLSLYPAQFDNLILSSLITEKTENLARISDCTEGLENRIKIQLKENLNLESLIQSVSTKRYTEARIRRIFLSCLLKIEKELIINSLNNNLYAKILAIGKNDKSFLSMICKNSVIPVLTRKSDSDNLIGIAKDCFDKDVLANDLYNLVSKEKTNQNNMVII